MNPKQLRLFNIICGLYALTGETPKGRLLAKVSGYELAEVRGAIARLIESGRLTMEGIQRAKQIGKRDGRAHMLPM
jgi:hypothetical protein